jgi:hypothetical protein
VSHLPAVGASRDKSQIPSSKSQPLPTAKSQIQPPDPNQPEPIRPLVFDFVVGVGLGFVSLGVVGAWDLELGI